MRILERLDNKITQDCDLNFIPVKLLKDFELVSKYIFGFLKVHSVLCVGWGSVGIINTS